jgi:3-oxoacyl-(acyl-carrier-protein) synthase
MMQFAREVKQQTPRFVSPLHFPQTVGNYAAGALARALKINGPNLTFGAGPHAGLAAVSEAAQLVKAGWADLFIAGGTDTVGTNLLPAMIDAGMVHTAGPFASRPAEGACFVTIESEAHARQRNARILAKEATPIVSADFTGRPAHDQAELEVVSDRSTGRPADGIVLSSRHLMGNAFAASAAAQLALAVAALNGDPCPFWTQELTEQPTRLDTRRTVPADADRALVLSAPDSAGRRVTICLQRP